jgi:hypothetical protein
VLQIEYLSVLFACIVNVFVVSYKDNINLCQNFNILINGKIYIQDRVYEIISSYKSYIPRGS